MSRARPLLFPLLVAMAVAAVSEGRAEAQQDPLKIAERLNKKALEDYDSLEFDSARQTLLSALGKLREAGLDETPQAATIYVSLGMVYIAGFKDKNRGTQQFVNALKINPSITLDSERATPELQEAFDAAVKQTGGGKKPGGKPPKGPGTPKPPPTPTPPPVEPELPDTGEPQLLHDPIDEGKAGQPVAVKAKLRGSPTAQKVFLFYRAAGQDDFVSLPMEQQAGEWVAEIPGDAIEGKTVQYYIEARDNRSRPVIASGSAGSPYIISVSGGAPPEDAEDPLANRRKKKKGQEEPKPDDEKGRGFGRLYLSLLFGTGVGIQPAGNHTEVAWQYQATSMQYVRQPVGSTGVALAPFHVGAELGVRITPAISIGALVRAQLFTGANAETQPDGALIGPNGEGSTKKAAAAFAAMLRFKYQFGKNRFHPYIHIDVGAGEIRHAIDVTSAQTADRPLVDELTAMTYNQLMPGANPDQIDRVCPATGSCVDTIAVGFVLFGGGAGIWYDLTTFKNGGLGLIADLNALFAVGGQFGINFDVQVGLGVHFM